MNLRHLKVFCAVVDREGFMAAAERLLMTQPAVSMQVQAVEQHFGLQLLQRGRRIASPTDAGALVYRWACEVLEMETKTRQSIERMKHQRTGKVVIGASMAISSYLLPPILSRFKRQHPEAELVVRLGDREAICEGILSGTVDFGVLMARDIPPGLEGEIFGTDEMVFTCAPGHRLASRKSVARSELTCERFILAPKGTSYRKVLD